jgi:hypothetical protein
MTGILNKWKAFRHRVKTYSTLKYRVFICIFITLMLVFGTSKLWLPSDVKITNSKIGMEQTSSPNVSLKLRSWVYSKSSHYMEITFDVHNNLDTQSLTFSPVAHTNVAKKKDMNVTTALYKDDTLIVQIKDVPQGWDVISLLVKDNFSDESNAMVRGANFYCDVREVAIDESLHPMSELDYRIAAVQNQIDDVNAQIKDCNDQIAKANTDIDQLNFDIQSLKDNQKYQTPDEQSKSNSVISSKVSQIDTLKNNILKVQEQIKNYNDKLTKLNEKMADTKNGTITDSSQAAAASSTPAGQSSSKIVTVN